MVQFGSNGPMPTALIRRAAEIDRQPVIKVDMNAVLGRRRLLRNSR
jgi:hypothetical protein